MTQTNSPATNTKKRGLNDLWHEIQNSKEKEDYGLKLNSQFNNVLTFAKNSNHHKENLLKTQPLKFDETKKINSTHLKK